MKQILNYTNPKKNKAIIKRKWTNYALRYTQICTKISWNLIHNVFWLVNGYLNYWCHLTYTNSYIVHLGFTQLFKIYIIFIFYLMIQQVHICPHEHKHMIRTLRWLIKTWGRAKISYYYNNKLWIWMLGSTLSSYKRSTANIFNIVLFSESLRTSLTF